MDKNLFFRSFAYHYLRRLPFGGLFGGNAWRKAAEEAEGAFVHRFYLCGIPVITLRSLDNVASVEIGPVPVLSIVNQESKICGYLGILELFKVRRQGIRPMPVVEPSFIPVTRTTKKLFFDIGVLHKKSGQYGIARTAYELLKALRKNMPEGYEVCPVYARADHAGYFLANLYMRTHFEDADALDVDFPIDISRGDIFLSVVPDTGGQQLQQHALHAMRRAGVRIFFLFYDLIPLSHPQFVVPRFSSEFGSWIRLISEFDGIIADSASAAEDYRQWREKNWHGTEPFSIQWFHLGANFKKSSIPTSLPEEAKPVLSAMKARPTLVEVSTIEPRKGYRQALSAFERLWSKGIEVNFVIVGNNGWMMDDFCAALEKHPERGRRLFWLRGISDDYLNAVYEAASGVLMPSETEGFGLAVIEGAYYGKPLILRDIPVFREIAGEHAAYFKGVDSQALADCIEQWLKDLSEGNVTPSSGIHPLTWDESAKMLLSRLPLHPAG